MEVAWFMNRSVASSIQVSGPQMSWLLDNSRRKQGAMDSLVTTPVFMKLNYH